jgi:hypothetical protein
MSPVVREMKKVWCKLLESYCKRSEENHWLGKHGVSYMSPIVRVVKGITGSANMVSVT